MNVKQFVKNFKDEKDSLLELYTSDENNQVEVVSKIKNMNLDKKQKEIMDEMLNDILNDVFYTVLLALDGSTSIGNSKQERFKIYDEKDIIISKSGDIESEAYEQFMS